MEAQLLLENTQKWTEEMYDWDEEHIHNYMFVEGSNHIVYIEYSYTQIGKTREWFKNISDEIGNPLVVRREILLQRLRGSSASPYDREDIDYIIECGHQPIKSVYLQDYYELNIYEELDKSIPYLVGVDCSTGTVGDNNAFTVINPYTIEPVAEFECAFCGETTYENILKELITCLLILLHFFELYKFKILFTCFYMTSIAFKLKSFFQYSILIVQENMIYIPSGQVF